MGKSLNDDMTRLELVVRQSYARAQGCTTCGGQTRFQNATRLHIRTRLPSRSSTQTPPTMSASSNSVASMCASRSALSAAIPHAPPPTIATLIVTVRESDTDATPPRRTRARKTWNSGQTSSVRGLSPLPAATVYSEQVSYLTCRPALFLPVVVATVCFDECACAVDCMTCNAGNVCETDICNATHSK